MESPWIRMAIFLRGISSVSACRSLSGRKRLRTDVGRALPASIDRRAAPTLRESNMMVSIHPVFRVVFWVLISAVQIFGAEQRLADFRHVVVSDKPSSVEKAAATELATYAGRVSGKPLDVIPLSK